MSAVHVITEAEAARWHTTGVPPVAQGELVQSPCGCVARAQQFAPNGAGYVPVRYCRTREAIAQRLLGRGADLVAQTNRKRWEALGLHGRPFLTRRAWREAVAHTFRSDRFAEGRAFLP